MGAAATPLGNMVIRLGLDDSDFGKGVANSKKQVKYLAKEMQANMKIADLAGNQLGKMGTQYDSLTKIIGAQEKQVSALRKAYDESFVDGKATDSTKRLAAELQDANGKLANYKLQLMNTAGAMTDWNVKNEGLTGNINSLSGNLISAGNHIQAFGKGIQGVGSGIQSLGGTLEGVGATLSKSITAPIVATTTAFAGSLIKIGLDVRKFRAQAQIYYEGLYQDSNRAKQQLDDLMNFAKTTPFSYESLVEADMVMQTFGMSTERAKMTLEAVANAIAATGGSSQDLERIATIFGQIESSGKLSLQDMNQLVNAKIPSFKIVANELGMTVMDLRSEISKGAITSDQAITALTKGLMQGTNGMNGATQAYTGALEKVKKSLPGAIDSLKSAWKNLALDLVDENGFEKVIVSINKVTDMLKSGAFNSVIKSAGTALSDLVDGVGNLAEKFAKLEPKQQQNIMKFIALAAAAGPVISIVGKLISGFGGVVVGSGKLITGLGKASVGIGNLGKSFVELSATMAKKKTFTETAEALSISTRSTKEFSTALSAGVGDVTKFGSAAASASGTSGIGAMSAALGPLGPAILGIVGVGGALAIGYGAWKLFGEEAWNSSQRVKNWGTDVGETTDKALTEVQGYTQSATRQFELMKKGLGNNTEEMSGNFAKMGESIEQNLIKKIEGLDQLIKELPASVDQSVTDMVKDEKEKTEKALEIVQQNNERILSMKKSASDRGVELSVAEAKIIQDLANQSTQAYVETLDLSAKEKKKVLDAMTGDVANATSEEAKLWLQSLAQQRQVAQKNMTASKQEKEKYLQDLGYNLDGEFAQKFMAAWDEINQTTVDGFDNQMALIVDKYPELANQVWLANGQIIDATNQTGQSMIKSNKEIIASVSDMTSKIRESADKNAENLGLLGDAGTKAGDRWNKIVLDTKTGKIKTNAVEAVRDATKSISDWNGLAFKAKEANLESNAKLVLAEAALANGHWDALEFMGKEALIESNATVAIIEATQQKGIWDNLSFDEKKALLYSDTSEKIAQAVSDMGLWDELSPAIKKLNAENFDFLNKINESETSLNNFNQHNPTLKKLLIDGSEKMNVDEATKALNEYNALREDQKVLLMQNQDYMTKINEAQGKLDTYNLTHPLDKRLITDSSNTVNNTSEAIGILNQYNGLYVPNKNIATTADISGAYDAQNAIDSIPDNTTKTITLRASVDAASNVLNSAMGAFGFKNGTNYHDGGPMIVNDQLGPSYKELVQFPNGFSFIPEGRDFFIPDAPRGTKVYTATQTKRMIPQYAKGVGIKNSDVSQIVNRKQVVTTDTAKLETLMTKMLNIIARMSPTININNPKMETDEDIRITSRKLAYLTEIEGRGKL